MNEYVNGLANEMYHVPFPSHLTGTRFEEIVKALYLNNNSLLFAVETTLLIDGGLTTTILMNPVNYVVKEGDHAFVISSDIEYA